ncbi:MAG: tetratricopeptide repeat protein, partial [Leptolyngbya sp. SIO4C5]|nr:tetratricopeptide repeat protein [Leptolyngbya sp. SIO4C5]
MHLQISVLGILASVLSFSPALLKPSYESLNLISASLEEASDQVIASHPEALRRKGWQLYYQGYLPAAIAPLQRALELEQAGNNPDGEAATLVMLAEVYIFQGEDELGLELSQQAVALYRELGDRRGEAEAMRILAMAQPDDNFDLILAKLKESQRIFEEVGTPIERGTVLADIGAINVKRKSFATGLEQLQEAIALLESEPQSSDEARRSGYYSALATAWVGLAHFRLEDSDKAFEVLEEALQLSRESKSLYAEALTHRFVGTVHYENDNFKQSLDSSQQAIEIYSTVEMNSFRDYEKSQSVWTYTSQGQAYSDKKEHTAAIQSFEQAIKTSQSLQKAEQNTKSLKIAIVHAQIGITHANLSITHNRYAEATELFQSDDFQQAHAVIDKAISSAKQTLERAKRTIRFAEEMQDSQSVELANSALHSLYQAIGLSYEKQGRIFVAQGKYKEDLEASQEALEVYQTSLPYALASNDPDSRDLAYQGIASSYNRISNAYGDLGDYQAAIEAAEKGLEPAQESGELQLELNLLLGLQTQTGDLGDQYRQAGEYEKALEVLERGLGYAEAMLAVAEKTNDQERGWVQQALSTKLTLLMNIGLVYSDQGNSRKALEIYLNEVELAQNLNDLEREIGGLQSIAATYRSLSEYDKALEVLSQLLETAEKTKNFTLKQSVLLLTAAVHDNIGQYDEAIAIYEEVANIARAENDWRTESSALNNLATIYSGRGEYEQALDKLNRNLDTAELIRADLQASNAVGNLKEECSAFDDYLPEENQAEHEDPALRNQSKRRQQESLEHSLELCINLTWYAEATALNNIAAVYDNQGRYQEAIDLYQEAIEIIRNTAPDRDFEATIIMNIGSVYQTQGNFDKSLEYHEQALKIFEEIESYIGIASTLSSIGVAYQDQGNYPKALDTLKQALEIVRQKELRPLEDGVLNNMSTVYLSQGNYEQAQIYLDQALELSQELELKPSEAINL